MKNLTGILQGTATERGVDMAKTVAIGYQDFEKIRKKNLFYVDKTAFIREWWENEDEVTLVTRPRRFGKTLNLSMLEKFFSLCMQDARIYSRDLQSGKMKRTETFREPIR